MSNTEDPATFEMEFPQRFAVKAMGANEASFSEHVTALIVGNTEKKEALSVTARESSNGKFMSVTVDIMATSRAQLDAIYQALTDDERVLMAL